MTRFKFVLRTFVHYFRSNLLVFLGISITTSVITGSLIIGDSMRFSLKQSVTFRLGNTTHAITSFDRYFRAELASGMEAINPGMKVTPVLLLNGIALSEGGARRVNKVQVIGIDLSFSKISGNDLFSGLSGDEVIIGRNLSERLKISSGDRIMLRIEKASLVPLNAPFISDTETSVSFPATIRAIAGIEQTGNLNLKNSQTAPFNVYLPIEKLNQLMEITGKANQLLIVANDMPDTTVRDVFSAAFKPADAGLIYGKVKATGEINVSTERVFFDPVIVNALIQIRNARPVLTYFVNRISTGGKSTPYSFVSALTDGPGSGDVWVNQWLADDLKAEAGDSISLSYFEIGPLRELETKERPFRITRILPLSGQWADSLLMPSLPGLSDAGHCREWEAGIPIDLEEIRDKDEAYWNRWRGCPKAFISDTTALEMWANRFGSYTAIRIPEQQFSEDEIQAQFNKNIKPDDLGFLVNPVRDQGIEAAANGTDFSQLFIGLGFFVLIAALLLSALLIRLNLETRVQHIGTQLISGFRKPQIIRLFMAENLLANLTGGLLGILLSMVYTRLIFIALNSLWFEIVRSDVLLLRINPITLIAGFIISLLFSMAFAWITLMRFMKETVSGLHKKLPVRFSRRKIRIRVLLLIALLVIALSLLLWQTIFMNRPDPGLFFLTGSLLLISLLILADLALIRSRDSGVAGLSLKAVALSNISRNRRRSMSIVILFSIGTFLVISTGSNRRDFLSVADKKSSGTGGFLFYAETSVPVLFNMNDRDRRGEENLNHDFNVLQFFRVEGDDASCLNLNRISQPAILGAGTRELAGRFGFSGMLPDGDVNDPWGLLDEVTTDGTVNAIADQTVIQWGLGKKVGDTLLYRNEKGDTLKLRLAAGLNASIFQGYVLISAPNFLKHFPTSSGTSVFLIDAKPETAESLGDELQSVFRDYGWEMQHSAHRLAEFNSVTNTYLSIFMALGVLGLILGTAGLAVILARTILERKKEISLLLTVGFREKEVRRLLVHEYFLLLSAGLTAGLIPAILAVLPSFLSSGSGTALVMVFAIAAIILLNGYLWIAGLSRSAVRNRLPVENLRND